MSSQKLCFIMMYDVFGVQRKGIGIIMQYQKDEAETVAGTQVEEGAGTGSAEHLFAPAHWFKPGRGPRYLQLHRHISAAILSGDLAPGDHLPPERDLAEMADISRVTVRKSVAQLVTDGLIEQRQGVGSFVRGPTARLQQSLSSLVSFTENMANRGMTSSSEVLTRGLFVPSHAELLTLGLSAGDRVARIRRLRSADGMPVALEQSALPRDILPDPERVGTSLYQLWRENGQAPTRAIQRVSVQRGHDARAYTLVAFGGAGGLHACRLAEVLGMTRVLVPVYGG